MNDVKFYLDAAEKKMQEAVDFLDDTLAHIRALWQPRAHRQRGQREHSRPAHHCHHALGAQHDWYH